MNRKQPARTDETRAPEPGLPEPLTVNIAEAERITGLGHRTLYRELAAGRLQAVKRGRSTLIKMDSIRSYLASLPAATFRQDRAA